MRPSVTTTSDPDTEALASLFGGDDSGEVALGPADEDDEDGEPTAEKVDPESELRVIRGALDKLEMMFRR